MSIERNAIHAILVRHIPAEKAQALENYLISHNPPNTTFDSEVCTLGIKVWFNSYGASRKAIERHFFQIEGSSYPVYPLVTNLTVEAIRPVIDVDKFKTFFGRWGPMLNVYPVLTVLPDTKETITTDDYRIILDVPEMYDSLEELGIAEEFQIPKIDLFKFKVAFFCRLCREDGHTQFQCVSRLKLQKASQSSAQSVCPPSPTVTSPLESSPPTTSPLYSQPSTLSLGHNNNHSAKASDHNLYQMSPPFDSSPPTNSPLYSQYSTLSSGHNNNHSAKASDHNLHQMTPPPFDSSPPTNSTLYSQSSTLSSGHNNDHSAKATHHSHHQNHSSSFRGYPYFFPRSVAALARKMANGKEVAPRQKEAPTNHRRPHRTHSRTKSSHTSSKALSRI